MNLRRSGSILKQGSKKQNQGSIVIGGMDEDFLGEKKTIIDEMALEAEEKANQKIGELTINAQREAEEIVAKARAEADSIEKQAFDKGYEAGKEQANQDCEEELQTTLKEAANILTAIEQERIEALKDEEKHIYKLIILICKKILDRELETSETTSLEFIEKALAELDYKANLTLTVNPFIGELLNENKSKLITEYPEIKQLSINTDNNLSKGDLIVEANRERIDHRLETKLEQLLTEILK